MMLTVNNYTAGYARNQFLFQEMSFELKPCEIIGITGTNGSGKSTFIKGLINLTPFRKGTICIDNDDVSQWDSSTIFRRKSIGYLSQRERVFSHLTVEENLRLYANYAKADIILEDDLYQQMQDIVQSKAKLPAANLSGGEQLILGLLCLTILNPKIVLLDEPSDSLDTKFKELLIQILLHWKKSKSILMVEQNTEILELTTNKTLKIN